MEILAKMNSRHSVGPVISQVGPLNGDSCLMGLMREAEILFRLILLVVGGEHFAHFKLN